MIALLPLFSLASPCAAPAAATPPSPAATDLPAFIDGVVRDEMAGAHIAGMTVAIVQHGRIVHLRGYGLASLSPATPVDPVSTLFRVGSLTKTFTWIAVMKEVERGRIDLNAPVNLYLPPRLRIPDDGFRRPIRMIDLMSHAAGFGDSELGHLIVDSPEKLSTLEDYLAAHRPPRVREPGLMSSYSNYGAALAGYIVARLNHATYAALIEQEVGRPFGLAHFSVREPYPVRAGLPAPMPAALARSLSRGFVWEGADFAPQPTEYLGHSAPSGAASMSAADAARYMLLLLGNGALDGTRLYSDRTAAAFRQPIMPVPRGINGWAHGFVVSSFSNGILGYGHSGATQFFFTNLVVIPSLDLGIFVSANTDTGWPISRRLPGLVVDYLLGTEAAIHRAGNATLARHAGDYAGLYRMTRRPYRGLEAFVDMLGGTSSVTVTGDGYLVTNLGPLTQSWVPDGSAGRFINTASDERLAFALDATGKATGFPLPSGNSWLERTSRFYDRATFDRAGTAVILVSALAWLMLLIRWSRPLHASRWQRWSQRAILAVSALWLAAAALFVAWLPTLSSPTLIYDFPGVRLPLASFLATVAAAGTLGSAITAPLTWTVAGGWPVWRRAAHSAAIALFTFFSVLLFCWHALTLPT